MLGNTPPSPWIAAHLDLAKPGGAALDLACGAGRHTRLLAAHGFTVTALDRDLAALDAPPQIERIAADLEGANPWPLLGRQFDLIVVTNYLHRPLFPAIAAALKPGGVLLYETFAIGNERYGKPSNPDFLLKDGELLEMARHYRLHVLDYHARYVGLSVRQSIAAQRAAD
jgi:SAM-dependent methyltransferase